jgi:Fic-DOC domain mobile mystery protein B
VSGLHAQPDDATPLTAEEREGLIPTNISLRRELNEVEQQNIYEATTWVLALSRGDPLTEDFAKRLHARMFGNVWKWAGEYRVSDKNIGVPPHEIQVRLIEALDSARYWIDHTTYPPDEIAARLHHGIVLVHPFPNGNGRWSRLMADVLLHRLEQKTFTWGRSSLRDAGATRASYIAALKAADRHDFGPLMGFVRS